MFPIDPTVMIRVLSNRDKSAVELSSKSFVRIICGLREGDDHNHVLTDSLNKHFTLRFKNSGKQMLLTTFQGQKEILAFDDFEGKPFSRRIRVIPYKRLHNRVNEQKRKRLCLWVDKRWLRKWNQCIFTLDIWQIVE
jgi:hypothetical protein